MTEHGAKKRIILASASPRRKEILTSMGASFTVLCADADESCDEKDPVLLTTELAKRKAEAALSLLRKNGDEDGAIIISADTVVCCNGEILGKPKDSDDAVRMLCALSDNVHTVATGIAVAADGKIYTDCSVTLVHVDNIPDAEIHKYVSSGDPLDKAGAYGIQGRFSQWICEIEGCYFGVVGLPTNKLASLFYKAVGCYPDEI